MKKIAQKFALNSRKLLHYLLCFKFELVTEHYIISVIGIDTAFPQKKE